jgi:hypothetical protein
MAEAYSIPGVSEVAVQRDKEIFAHYSGAEVLEGVTIAFAAAGELAAGTVLGRVTATGKYVAYTDAGTNGAGSDTAVCILRTHVKVDAAGDTLGEAVFGKAVLKNDQLVGVTASAITDLGAKVDTVRNTFMF